MRTVVVVGVTNVRFARAVDEFPVPFRSDMRLPHGISVRVSGTGYTVARVLRELGSPVALATYVGADDLGTVAVRQLMRLSLYGPGTQVCTTQPRAVVLYDRDGTRAGCTDLRDTPGMRYPVGVFADLLEQEDPAMVVLGNIGFTAGLTEPALCRGVPIAADLHGIDAIDSAHNQPWLCSATVLASSHEQLPVAPAHWVRLVWRRYGTSIVLVGCGADGVVVGERASGRIWQVHAVTPRGVRYTSGAGDTLLAGFVHHLLLGGDPVRAAGCAVLGAGWKVGADPDDLAELSPQLIEKLRGSHWPRIEPVA